MALQQKAHSQAYSQQLIIFKYKCDKPGTGLVPGLFILKRVIA